MDTACTIKSVVGEVRIKELSDIMGGIDRKHAEQSKIKRWSLFKFGDRKESKSNHKLTMPMLAGGKWIRIVLDNHMVLQIGKKNSKVRNGSLYKESQRTLTGNQKLFNITGFQKTVLKVTSLICVLTCKGKRGEIVSSRKRELSLTRG